VLCCGADIYAQLPECWPINKRPSTLKYKQSFFKPNFEQWIMRWACIWRFILECTWYPDVNLGCLCDLYNWVQYILLRPLTRDMNVAHNCLVRSCGKLSMGVELVCVSQLNEWVKWEWVGVTWRGPWFTSRRDCKEKLRVKRVVKNSGGEWVMGVCVKATVSYGSVCEDNSELWECVWTQQWVMEACVNATVSYGSVCEDNSGVLTAEMRLFSLEDLFCKDWHYS